MLLIITFIRVSLCQSRMVKEMFCFVLIFITVAYAAADKKCQGGAECINIKSCTGLYNTLLGSGSNPQLTKMLQSLHCGYDNFSPKICCPPAFVSVVVNTRDNFPSDYENTERDSKTFLPDRQTCGIQIQNKRFTKHPWTALLKYIKTIGWGFYCGGVLISSKYVLTTASCVRGEDLPSTWILSQVRLGDWDVSRSKDCYHNECSNPYLDVMIEKTIVHENYSPSDKNQYNDIALLRLTEDVQVTDYIKPICLPTNAGATFEDYVAEVAGWGRLGPQYSSKIKQISATSIIGVEECSSILGRYINENQICAGGARDFDTCVGDLGGALMGHASNESNWVSLGLLSYRAEPRGCTGFPNVYTRIDSYFNWIDQNIES